MAELDDVEIDLEHDEEHTLLTDEVDKLTFRDHGCDGRCTCQKEYQSFFTSIRTVLNQRGLPTKEIIDSSMLMMKTAGDQTENIEAFLATSKYVLILDSLLQLLLLQS